MNLRTILAALRRRHRGERKRPATRVGSRPTGSAHIETNWAHPDFKLGHIFPWISPARQHLENGESAALEELPMDLVWDLSRSAFGKYSNSRP